jgi:uncharacterized protein
MHRKLPKEIDPFRLAQNGIELEGEIELRSMPRLLDYLVADEGMVTVKMLFGIDEIGTRYMRGQFSCELSLLCERCLSPMTTKLDVDCLLAMVMSEGKMAGLAEQYDPWLIENDEPVSLSAVVEDELILALPIVPRHEEPCIANEDWTSGTDEGLQENDKPASPFAVLSELKTKH